MTLKAIGDRLGLTRERVRQLEVEGLSKLREMMEAA
jgi:DNA-directed RNA polymerase sigma subunit (sigma70/sigma32)